MGFFGNIGINEKEEVGRIVKDYINNNPNFGKWVDRVLGDGGGILGKLNIGSRTLESLTNNSLFKVEDDLSVSFRFPVFIYKTDTIPFTLSNNCPDICVKRVGQKVLDCLPSDMPNSVLCINNCMGRPKVKNVRVLSIVNDKSEDDSKFANIDVSNIIVITDCKKLKRIENIKSTEFGTYTNFDIFINKCTALETINLSYILRNINSLRIDSKCTELKNMYFLPEINTLFAPTISREIVEKFPIQYAEVKDWKGKFSTRVNNTLSHNDIIEVLKEKVNDIKSKRWKIFPDLAAVLTYYGLAEWAGIEKSDMVGDGRIFTCEREATIGGNGYYTIKYHQSHKSGICNILNGLGVRYEIKNDSPRKKKVEEYVKIL